MRVERKVGRVEDYTNAFLATLALLLFFAFCCITAIFGFVWAVFTAAALDQARALLIRPRDD